MTDEDVRKAVWALRSLHADMLYSQRSPGMWAASIRILEIAADLDAALAEERSTPNRRTANV